MTLMKTLSQSWGEKCDVFGVRTRLNLFLESPSYILDSKSNIQNKILKNIKAHFLANKQVYLILLTDSSQSSFLQNYRNLN